MRSMFQTIPTEPTEPKPFAVLKAESEIAKAQRLPHQLVGDWITRLNQFWANADQDFFDALGDRGQSFFEESAAYSQFLGERFSATNPELIEAMQQAVAECVKPHEFDEDGRVVLTAGEEGEEVEEEEA